MPEVQEKIRTDYTEGSILSSILKMGLPSMFGFLSQNIYGLVDTFWVSRLPNGEDGVAGITFFGTVLWLFFSFNQLVGPGSVAIISRRYGERAYDLAEKAVKEAISLKLFFGFLFGIVGYVFLEKMLILMGARDAALEMGIAYGRIIFIGMGVMYATYSIYTGMRGVANPQLAMILMISSNVLNLVLDPLCMFGYLGLPAWGVKGAAIASITSFALTLSVGLYLFSSNRTNVTLHLRGKERMAVSSMWKMVKIGIPAWLGEMSFSSSRLVITPLIATFGTSVVAAYGVGNQITHFGMMILVGIGLGLSSLIGHTIGSGKLKRAKQTADHAILLGVGIMTAFALVTFTFARELMALFFDSPETIRHGVVMLRIFASGFPFLGAFLIMEEIHVGVGLNTPTMVMSVIHAWVFQAFPVYVLTQLLGLEVTAVWWTICLSLVVSSTAFYFYYRRGRWMTMKV